MENKALGLIEVYGYLTAIQALDSALKAANVRLFSLQKVKGGLVTVMISGDVGAIKAAVDAACASAERIGTLVSAHVIARPSLDVLKMLNENENLTKTDKAVLTKSFKKEQLPKVPLEALNNSDTSIDNKTDSRSNAEKNLTEEQIKTMTVAKLRKLARQIKLDNIKRTEIKFAKQSELVEKICEFIKRSDE